MYSGKLSLTTNIGIEDWIDKKNKTGKVAQCNFSDECKIDFHFNSREYLIIPVGEWNNSRFIKNMIKASGKLVMVWVCNKSDGKRKLEKMIEI